CSDGRVDPAVCAAFPVLPGRRVSPPPRSAGRDRSGWRSCLEGEAYFINNYTILHARTAFDDGDAPEDARRHLLRLWLDAPIRPVHPYIRSRGILPVAGRTPSFDWSSIAAVRH